MSDEPQTVRSDRFEQWEARYGLITVAFMVGLVTQCLSFVAYSYHLNWSLEDTVGRLGLSYAPMCENPWRTDLIGEPQVRHRILAPIISWSLGLRGKSGVLVPIAVITLIGMFTYLTLRSRGIPPWLAWLGTLLLGTTPVIYTSQVWIGCTDSFGYLTIILCLYFRKLWPLFVVMFLGMLGEERAIAALPLILLWHFTQEEPGWPRWRSGIVRALLLMAAAACWFLVYRWVNDVYVLPSLATASPEVLHEYEWTRKVFQGVALRQQLLTIPSGIHYSFRAGFILPILLIMVWWPKRWWEAGLVLLGYLLGLIPAILVTDVTRVSAYQFPLLLLALVHVYRVRHVWAWHAVLGAVLVNFVTPAYMTTGRFHNWMAPLPVNAVRRVLGV